MKAFVVERYGKDGLRAGDVPEPELRDSDVLVRVRAASVNPLDSKIRDGEFRLILPYRPPFVLGHDVAGVVTRVGTEVQRFTVGDEVYARPDKDRIGTFAELIAIDQDDLGLKPTSLSMQEASAVPLVGLTAWQALVERGKVTAGQKVLIHAGSGGVGTMAIQLAKYLGATVATTTSTANLERVKGLGADVVVDYKKDDFATVLSDYDLVLDSLGGETLEKSLTVVKPGGLVIGIGGPPDSGLREGARNAMVRAHGHHRAEPPHPHAGEAAWRHLLVPVHAGQRGAAARAHHADRRRTPPPGRRPGLPLRRDARGGGVRRPRARQGQGRCHARLARPRTARAGTPRSADLINCDRSCLDPHGGTTHGSMRRHRRGCCTRGPSTGTVEQARIYTRRQLRLVLPNLGRSVTST